MATASFVSKKVIKEVVVKQEHMRVESINLEISFEEAQMLMELLSSVGGYRPICDNLYSTLSGLGFHWVSDRKKIIVASMQLAGNAMTYIKEKAEETQKKVNNEI